ncbi:alpha-glucuronidase A [Apiospora sp. TS-2023a]
MRPFLLLLTAVGLVAAENGIDAWLRYAALPCDIRKAASVPAGIVALDDTETSPVYTAGQELHKGILGILQKDLAVASTPINGSSITIGTVDAFTSVGGALPGLDLKGDGFWLSIKGDSVQIVGQNERGALYGTFQYLSMLAQGNFTEVAYESNPSAPIRWVNQWDNMDDTGTHGSIERGYGGPSIFFAEGLIVEDLTRVSQYARLMASIGLNGIIVNNVNANVNLLNSTNMAGLGRIADAMRPWGVRTGISLNFDSPRTLGKLTTADPLDEGVIQWWDGIATQLHDHVPDFAGVLVKANSESQPGPLTYNRTLADGANLFARAIKPLGDGIVMFRAFVYDNTINETNWKADRANAAVDFFRELDGKFDDNVVVQIKYGPIDFQVREPVSPLFGHLQQTGSVVELQVTQEYLGQQCHLVYLPPLWKTILNFDMKVDNQPSLVRDIVSGERFNQKLAGYAAVVNVGTNTSWLGSHLAMSNFYAYGRLAWEPTSDDVSILEDWTRLTFGSDRTIIDTITKMSMESWPAHENYTGNLGIQSLTDITGPHYGPKPQSQDGNGWGQWTRADATSIGMDRTVWNGTGYSGQYAPEIAALFEDIETTPDDLLLWFHHVPYTQQLKSGKTVIQHFYDAHYAGAAVAQTFPKQWEALKGLIDAERYDEVAFRLEYQAGHALVWRDAINDFYLNMSSIKDEHGRVGNHPWRIEAEDMELDGYTVIAVDPFETASGFHAIRTTSNTTAGTATAMLDERFAAGTYDVAVNYFDVKGGRAHYEIFLNDESLGTWVGNHEDRLGYSPSPYPDGHSATRIYFRGVQAGTGDMLRIVGRPDGGEQAPLDYVSVLPSGTVD